MTEIVKKASKEIQIVGKSRIDSRADLIEPIDFSFKDLMNLEEFFEAQPRFDEKHGEPKRTNGKYSSLGLKLGYNVLAEINGLFDWCVNNFQQPLKISTIDLSFNCLKNIPEELLKFEGLKCLYLHGNKITDLTEVDKLKCLNNLTALSVHGNPIENIVGFRLYIISKLPTLKHVNFSGISKADRQTAEVWIRSNRKPLKTDLGQGKTAGKKPLDETEE